MIFHSHSLLKMLEKEKKGMRLLEIDKVISLREDKSDSFHIDSHQPLLRSVIIRPWNTKRHSSLSRNHVTPMIERSQGQYEFSNLRLALQFLLFLFPRKCIENNKLIVQGQRVVYSRVYIYIYSLLENRLTVMSQGSNYILGSLHNHKPYLFHWFHNLTLVENSSSSMVGKVIRARRLSFAAE